MSKITQKQHVPIFVGSTFVDMKQYRESTFQALTRIEAIVRGMEYFGSKSNAPLDVCLDTVRSCKLYVGLFGMRYGSIPDEHTESMTHLEYLEAQKHKLPSLIYIIDSEMQPILPKFVETGDGADKLSSLKTTLQKKHTCSYFTTPEDLAAKLLHDVPNALAQIGAEVSDLSVIEPSENHEALIAEFMELPALMKGEEVTFCFKLGSFGFRSTAADDCDALRLRVGGTVSAYCTMDNGKSAYIYAADEIAKAILKVEKGCTIRAKGVTAFGKTYSAQWTDEGPIREVSIVKGLRLTEILEITSPNNPG